MSATWGIATGDNWQNWRRRTVGFTTIAIRDLHWASAYTAYAKVGLARETSTTRTGRRAIDGAEAGLEYRVSSKEL